MAVEALAPLAGDHDIVITHGNGPQVGLLAIESAHDPDLAAPYPLDVLGAQTQGMIGYWLLQALGNALPGRQIVSLICQTVVAADDPAFAHPTKFVGPIYDEAKAHRLAKSRGWEVRPDGPHWRRVVASPEPLVIVELPAIRASSATPPSSSVRAAAGSRRLETPTVSSTASRRSSTRTSPRRCLPATSQADALVILTDVANVELGFGTDDARAIGHTTAATLRRHSFADGSMGPKVEAACRFVEETGKPAMIGRLADVADLLGQRCGTVVEPATAIAATTTKPALQRG